MFNTNFEFRIKELAGTREFNMSKKKIETHYDFKNLAAIINKKLKNDVIRIL